MRKLCNIYSNGRPSSCFSRPISNRRHCDRRSFCDPTEEELNLRSNHSGEVSCSHSDTSESADGLLHVNTVVPGDIKPVQRQLRCIRCIDNIPRFEFFSELMFYVNWNQGKGRKQIYLSLHGTDGPLFEY